MIQDRCSKLNHASKFYLSICLILGEIADSVSVYTTIKLSLDLGRCKSLGFKECAAFTHPEHLTLALTVFRSLVMVGLLKQLQNYISISTNPFNQRCDNLEQLLVLQVGEILFWQFPLGEISIT